MNDARDLCLAAARGVLALKPGSVGELLPEVMKGVVVFLERPPPATSSYGPLKAKLVRPEVWHTRFQDLEYARSVPLPLSPEDTDAPVKEMDFAELCALLEAL